MSVFVVTILLLVVAIDLGPSGPPKEPAAPPHTASPTDPAVSAAPAAPAGTTSPVETDAGGRVSTGRLHMHRNPVRMLLSVGPWAAAWFLFTYLFTGPALFTVALTVLAVAGVLSALL